MADARVSTKAPKLKRLDTIRVFVGCAANGEDAESMAVLEHTIRKHTTGPVKIHWMMLSHRPGAWSGWNTERWATPFSGLRWAIPAVCKYKGRAIYMDSDMIVMRDLRDLWTQEIPWPAFALARKDGGKVRTCVMLIDCKRAKLFLPGLGKLKAMKDQRAAIYAMAAEHPGAFAPLDPFWNCVDLKGARGIDDPRINILHYSEMSTQPHLVMAQHRLAAKGRKHWYDGEISTAVDLSVEICFLRLLTSAARAGYTVRKYEPETPYGDYGKRSLAAEPLKHFRDAGIDPQSVNKVWLGGELIFDREGKR